VTVPRLFDSHLHLTASRFDDDRHAVLEDARAAGVAEMVSIASSPEDAADAIALARAEPGVWATAGLHPHEAARTSAALMDDIERLAGAPEVVAIGETGLDYHYDSAPRELQLENFRAHVELSRALDLPIVVHTREADGDTAAVIEGARGGVTGVLHCFSAGSGLLATGLAAGWYVSFSGLVTFVPELEDAVREVPLDRLLIETDAPYLAPAPMRGRRNEPAFLRHTCHRVAEIRGLEPEEIARATRANARRFYGLGQDET